MMFKRIPPSGGEFSTPTRGDYCTPVNMKPKSCSRCHQTNPATNEFCLRCGLPLDQATESELLRKDLERKDADAALDGLLHDEEFREMLIKKIETMKNAN